MAEILLLDALLTELDAVARLGEGLVAGQVVLSESVCTEPTKEFTHTYLRLRSVLQGYCDLLRKDIGDVKQFYENMHALDQSGS